MKILKIHFKNINSLRGEWEIDFTRDPFRRNALFAITGPTGSGKSTLLDVITLALYNEVPRMDQKITRPEIEKKGAILTRGQKEAFAAVTYQSKSGEYISTWRISTARTGNLRDYEMELADAHTKNIISDKKSDVPIQNAELIGLQYEQFIRSVLLAQGDFARFLQVNKKDRSELLEKITGRDIYRKLGQRAHEKAREIKNKTDDLKKRIEDRRGDLLETEVLENYLKLRMEWIDQLENYDSELKKLELQIDGTSRLNKEKERGEKLQKSVLVAKQELADFQENQGIKLSDHNKVAPFREAIFEYGHHQDRIRKLIKQNSELESQSKQIQLHLEHDLSMAENLISGTIDPSHLHERLETFEKKILDLDQEIHQALKDYKAKEGEIESILSSSEISRSLNIKNFKENIEHEREKAVEKINASSAVTGKRDMVEIERLLHVLETEKEDMYQAKSQSEKIKSLQESARELEDQIKQIKEKLKTLPEQITYNEIELKDKQKDLTILIQEEELRKWEAKYEEDRTQLEDQQPCPMCGALEHPYAHNYVKRENKSDRIKPLEKVVMNLSSRIAVLRKQQEERTAELSRLYGKNQKIKSEVEAQLRDFREKFQWSFEAEWQELEQELKKKIVEHKTVILAKKWLFIIDQVQPRILELDRIKSLGADRRNQRNDLYKEKDISKAVREIKSSWQKHFVEKSNIDTALDKNVKELHDLKNVFHEQQNELLEKLVRQNIESIEWAQKAILSQEDFLVLDKLGSDLKENLLTIETYLKDNQGRIEAENIKWGNNDLKALIEKKEELDKINRGLRGELEIKNRLINNHHDTQKLINNLERELLDIQKKNKAWLMLRDLIGDSKGDKFNSFAQELTLLQLLGIANRRLANLSQRYIIANPTEDEDDSLTVIDKDMGGQRRSVKTLSGGETFVISLALALALSDLASQNVRIDSMFIDEGFGTLDPETLDQTLDSLERLQQEGSKMIGIISHVTSLKERIATQIQISQNGQGYSRLEVV